MIVKPKKTDEIYEDLHNFYVVDLSAKNGFRVEGNRNWLCPVCLYLNVGGNNSVGFPAYLLAFLPNLVSSLVCSVDLS